MKVDLTLLNSLVKELNEQSSLADKLPTENTALANAYIAELSKCMGLVTTLALEASALSHDFMKEIKMTSDKASGKDVLDLTSNDPFGFGDLLKKVN